MIPLTDFLDASPTAFHAADTVAASLDAAGWVRLDEKDVWKLQSGTGYYVIRSSRSVAAFIPGSGDVAETGLRISASHLDSPLWKIKTEGISMAPGAWRLPVEAYGGPIDRTWLDRELEVVGRVSYMDSNKNIFFTNWRSNKPTAIIPSLAIHFDREVNKGVELNRQSEMAALMPWADGDSAGDENSEDIVNPIISAIAVDIGCKHEDVLSTELYLVPSAKAAVLGEGENSWIVSGRLDNLAMAHAMLESLPDPKDDRLRGIMSLWFDAEEIGSRTDAGAASVFPDEMIERFVLSAGGGREDLMRCRRSSLLLSADMAHSLHPNYKDKHDTAYPAVMGKGPVIKSHGQRHYGTDVETEGLIKASAVKAGIDTQKLIFRSDIPCGYSLGPLASSVTSIPTVDVGNPLWGMHSSRETASMQDHENMIRLMVEHWKD